VHFNTVVIRIEVCLLQVRAETYYSFGILHTGSEWLKREKREERREKRRVNNYTIQRSQAKLNFQSFFNIRTRKLEKPPNLKVGRVNLVVNHLEELSLNEGKGGPSSLHPFGRSSRAKNVGSRFLSISRVASVFH